MSADNRFLALLKDPVAQKLLQSAIPARFAYIWYDGTPRVVPIWFHWNGTEIVLGTPMKAPKVHVLSTNPKVALTIDDNMMPYKALQIRGTAQVETVEGVVPEYALSAERYLGMEQGKAWVGQVRSLFTHMVRISIRPEWVNILDFEQRFPSAIANAMAGQ